MKRGAELMTQPFASQKPSSPVRPPLQGRLSINTALTHHMNRFKFVETSAPPVVQAALQTFNPFKELDKMEEVEMQYNPNAPTTPPTINNSADCSLSSWGIEVSSKMSDPISTGGISGSMFLPSGSTYSLSRSSSTPRAGPSNSDNLSSYTPPPPPTAPTLKFANTHPSHIPIQGLSMTTVTPERFHYQPSSGVNKMEISDTNETATASSTSSPASASTSANKFPFPSSNSANKTMFPIQLYRMINEESDSIISWKEGGRDGFTIRGVKDLEGIMKKYFRHNRFSSLQRQLNMYGFSKKTRGGSKDLHFHNPLFYRNMTKEDFELVVSSKRRKDAEKQMSHLTVGPAPALIQKSLVHI
ncbi:hypothetical protein TrVE_jg4421 [Triparma verrucosa]|uniref:HSF-type DNA-binding domain-containing protein n=1 Tax=Triparma verrucosa TaxID=1606542 RepID=A0A9W7BG21_9STRA|nr:hypothetical protein TrVE_jg4421 [Triparma verrucosa]